MHACCLYWLSLSISLDVNVSSDCLGSIYSEVVHLIVEIWHDTILDNDENALVSMKYFGHQHTVCTSAIWCLVEMHDDVIKWKHFPRYWLFVRGIHRSPVTPPHKGQWRGALMFSLICAWINDCINNGEAGDFRRYRAHYDVIVMDNPTDPAFYVEWSI